MQGSDVHKMQIALIHKGYEIEPDGVFGPLTQWAVEKFQAAVGLPIDEIAGLETQRILHTRGLYLSDPYILGSDVREVQAILARIGYDVSANGVFGLKTQQAVLDFQRYFNLPEDGVVHGLTLTRLFYIPSMAEAS